MKKLLALVLALICLLGLVGCDPGVRYADVDALLRDTVKIELVYYENTKPKLRNVHDENTSTFNFDKTTFIATLDESRFEDVINDIGSGYMTDWARTLNEPIGKTMILYQRNGNMVVLFGCEYNGGIGGTKYFGHCNIYDKDGKLVEYLGDIGHEYVDYLQETYFEDNESQ